MSLCPLHSHSSSSSPYGFDSFIVCAEENGNAPQISQILSIQQFPDAILPVREGEAMYLVEAQVKLLKAEGNDLWYKVMKAYSIDLLPLCDAMTSEAIANEYSSVVIDEIGAAFDVSTRIGSIGPRLACSCAFDREHDAKGWSISDPPNPYLIRGRDAHSAPAPTEEVQANCEFMRNIPDSYHDDALSTLLPPLRSRFASIVDHEVGYLKSGDSPNEAMSDDDNQDKLLCVVYTMESHHHSHLPNIISGWGSRCSGFIAFSTSGFDAYPHTIHPLTHDGEESYDNIWQKIVSILKYLRKHYLNEFDYFYICGDDTYLIPGHLLGLLSSRRIREQRDRGEGIYLGRQFRIDSDGYLTNLTFNSGGPGYVLDRLALDKLGLGLEMKIPACKSDDVTSAEDTRVAGCLRHLGIMPTDTRDDAYRNRFHHKSPHTTWTFMAYDWFAQNSLPPLLVGPLSISNTSIAFHWVNPSVMAGLDYFFMQCLYWPAKNNHYVVVV